jgi:hypothetical protein
MQISKGLARVGARQSARGSTQYLPLKWQKRVRFPLCPLFYPDEIYLDVLPKKEFVQAAFDLQSSDQGVNFSTLFHNAFRNWRIFSDPASGGISDQNRFASATGVP